MDLPAILLLISDEESMESLQTVEIEPSAEAEGCVIWLHGLGADGHDFEPIVPELQLPASLPLRFVFPHAPVRPVTINNGMAMRAWFDILSLDRGGLQDEQGIRESSSLLRELIGEQLERGIAHDKILLAGFSQGGAIALHTGLRESSRLAGLMALSTYLPLHQNFVDEVANSPQAQPREVPILMAHGRLDPMLPLQLGQDSAAAIRAAGYQVDWHEYPMAHSVCAEEIAEIRRWLISVYQPG